MPVSYSELHEYLICVKLKILFTTLDTITSIQENKIKLDSNRSDREGKRSSFEAEAVNSAASD